jgi:hypothetical protein
MVHLCDPERAQLCNLFRQLGELGLVLVKNGIDFFVGDGCHQFFWLIID